MRVSGGEHLIHFRVFANDKRTMGNGEGPGGWLHKTVKNACVCKGSMEPVCLSDASACCAARPRIVQGDVHNDTRTAGGRWLRIKDGT